MAETQKISVLAIEDEPEIRKFLAAALVSNGFSPAFALTGREGLAHLKARVPEILILDLGLPDMDGLEIIKSLRGWSDIPVIILSARGQEQDKIAALELGADDYLTKPFSTGELLARLKAALRRARRAVAPAAGTFTAHGLSFDAQNRAVKVDGNEIRLTPTEFRLLALLVKHAGKIVTHKQLLQEVWGKSSAENNHYLRIYTQHLRQKLGDDPLHPRFIITAPGVGYKLNA
ncbi:MAG: response regulator [Alphaproteobacteria bacterium]|nr:response regulator [Alphaproteobacteria bacterium]MDE2336735.1 response regulator [Alphaproteobacteria bacterium]